MKYEKFLLTGENKKQLFVPKGFAHAYLVLSNTAIFSYKVDNVYNPDYESGIIWNDPNLKIDWELKNPILSDRDLNWPSLKQQNNLPIF